MRHICHFGFVYGKAQSKIGFWVSAAPGRYGYGVAKFGKHRTARRIFGAFFSFYGRPLAMSGHTKTTPFLSVSVPCFKPDSQCGKTKMPSSRYHA
jgi:hypothetical protein